MYLAHEIMFTYCNFKYFLIVITFSISGITNYCLTVWGCKLFSILATIFLIFRSRNLSLVT